MQDRCNLLCNHVHLFSSIVHSQCDPNRPMSVFLWRCNCLNYMRQHCILGIASGACSNCSTHQVKTMQ